MKTLLLAISFSLISAAAPLTARQLDVIRQQASAAVSPTYTKAQANAFAVGCNTWLETNRGTLPNKFRASDLSTAQRTVIDALAPALRATERVSIFNAVADLWGIIPPAPPDPLDLAIQAVKAELRRIMSAAIDAAQPGLTATEKREAVRKALQEMVL